MIVHFVDGSDWVDCADEMKNHEKLAENILDEEVLKQYKTFLRKSKFPLDPCVCNVCNKWLKDMNQCPCKQVYYCCRHCQKKDWKAHKPNCTASNASTPSPIASPTSTAVKSP